MIDTDPALVALKAAKHGYDIYKEHQNRKSGERPSKIERKKQRQSPPPAPKQAKRQHNTPNILFFITISFVTVVLLRHHFGGELPQSAHQSEPQSQSETQAELMYMTREEYIKKYNIGTVQADNKQEYHFPDSMQDDEKKLRRDLEPHDFSFTIQLELLIKAVLRIGDVPLYSVCNQYFGSPQHLKCESVLALKAKMFEIQHKGESVKSIKSFIKGIEKAIKGGEV